MGFFASKKANFTDFPTAFVSLRDKMQTTWHEINHESNVMLCGKTVALHSWFDSTAEVALLGVMKTGGTTHSHEHRALLGMPDLTEAGLTDAWAYVQKLQEELVQADEDHGFTIISLTIATQNLDTKLHKAIHKMYNDVQYRGAQAGWSNIRVCVVDLATGKCVTDKCGAVLGNLVKSLL